jgi:GT2 family glycosyltransferase
MSFSIIIINYKTEQLTINCVNSILALPDNNREIIVIDNASGESSVKIIENELGGKIKLIKNQINLGFAGANNQGAALAQGDFLLFLNSDTIIKDNIFKNIENLFINDSQIGIISPRLKTENNNYQKMAFGLFPTFWKIITRKSQKEINIESSEKQREVDWVSGCSLFIKKDVFNKTGGWDDNFFLYFEDIDLCKRVKDKGYKIIVDNTNSIIHLGGKSLKANKERKKYYYASQDYYFKKHHNIFTQLGIKVFREVATAFKNYD